MSGTVFVQDIITFHDYCVPLHNKVVFFILLILYYSSLFHSEMRSNERKESKEMRSAETAHAVSAL